MIYHMYYLTVVNGQRTFCKNKQEKSHASLASWTHSLHKAKWVWQTNCNPLSEMGMASLIQKLIRENNC